MRCADRFENSYFSSPFGYRDKHNIHNSYSSYKKRNRSDGEKNRIKYACDCAYTKDRVVLGIHKEVIAWRIRDVVEFSKRGFDIAHNGWYYLNRFGMKNNAVIVFCAENIVLYGGVGDSKKFICVENENISYRREYSYYFKKSVIYFDIFSKVRRFLLTINQEDALYFISAVVIANQLN